MPELLPPEDNRDSPAMLESSIAWPANSAPGARRKPLLRGWSHAIAAAVSAAVLMLWVPQDNAGAVRFVIAMMALFSLSALYHLGSWGSSWRILLRRLDHACIFFFIAACVTGFLASGSHAQLRDWSIDLVWLLAAGFMLRVLVFGPMPRTVGTGIYAGLGTFGAACAVLCQVDVSTGLAACFLAGGLVHLAGAFVYARRWPNPAPSTFGFHEVFHLLVIAANALLLTGLWLWPANLATGA